MAPEWREAAIAGTLSDLVSAFGIPAGTAITAYFFYRVGMIADTEVQAGLTDRTGAQRLSRALADRSVPPSVIPAVAMVAVFEGAFGPRHLSFRCFGRSVVATLTIVFSFWLTFDRPLPPEFVASGVAGYIGFVVGMALNLIVPVYLSLWKTRAILRGFGASSQARLWLVIVPDLLLSAAVFLLVFGIFNISSHVAGTSVANFTAWQSVVFSIRQWLTNVQAVLIAVFQLPSHGSLTQLPVLFLLCTTLTSIWFGTIFAAVLLLRLVQARRRSAVPAFDLDDWPFRTVGGMAAVVASVVCVIVGLVTRGL